MISRSLLVEVLIASEVMVRTTMSPAAPWNDPDPGVWIAVVEARSTPLRARTTEASSSASARRSATEVAAARVGAAIVMVRSVFAAIHSAAWTNRVVLPDPGGESMMVTRLPETVSYSALASTDPGTSRCQDGTCLEVATSSGEGSVRGGRDVSIPKVFRSSRLRAMLTPPTDAGYAPPVGATHRPWDTAPPARRAQLVARDGCGAPPGSSTAHRSSHAGTAVAGTDGIAAPAPPPRRVRGPPLGGARPPAQGTRPRQHGGLSWWRGTVAVRRREARRHTAVAMRERP